MFPYMETRTHWKPATRWIKDIPVGSHDDAETQIIEYLTGWEFEDLEVLDYTEPVWTGDGYIVYDVEIRYTWGYTEEFAAQHGVAI